jgi:hypothetical protein
MVVETMNGPEHYSAAGQLVSTIEVSLIAATESGDQDTIDRIEEMAVNSIAVAQVHATLAVAAALGEIIQHLKGETA